MPRSLVVFNCRLTLVKGKNMDLSDVQQYAKLVDLGQPDFIEVKGVTYCKC